MTRFRFKKLEGPQYISVRGKGYWWQQRACQPHEILSESIPKGVRIMLHKGLTPEKFVGTHYAVSDIATGGLITHSELLPVFDKNALCLYAIQVVNQPSYPKNRESNRLAFDTLVGNLEFRGIRKYQADMHKVACHYFAPNRFNL